MFMLCYLRMPHYRVCQDVVCRVNRAFPPWTHTLNQGTLTCSKASVAFHLRLTFMIINLKSAFRDTENKLNIRSLTLSQFTSHLSLFQYFVLSFKLEHFPQRSTLHEVELWKHPLIIKQHFIAKNELTSLVNHLKPFSLTCEPIIHCVIS